ncbi:hypothetical protein NG726_27525 [Pseudomonas sp. MOB-449]|nr:hypothetical protein [Pseudomonas sp. MOB-449]
MKNKKRGKPALQESEKRTNKILVALNAEEYERLLVLMDEKGFDSPAVFLRSSGLRSELPPKVVINTNRLEVYKLIVSSVKTLDFAISQDFNQKTIIKVREHLADIARALLDASKGEQA